MPARALVAKAGGVSRSRVTGLQALLNALEAILDAAEAQLDPRDFAVLVDIHGQRVERLRRRVERMLQRWAA